MTIPPTTPPASRRLRGIDALRGVAALGVVLFHAVDQGRNALPNNLFEYPVRLVQFASSFGYIGVFLFFVISGFCIHLQWARAKAAGNEPDIRFGSFWKRRIRRLYPPYVLALLLYLLLTAYTVGLDLTHFLFYDIGMHLLMLHNLDPHTCYTKRRKDAKKLFSAPLRLCVKRIADRPRLSRVRRYQVSSSS